MSTIRYCSLFCLALPTLACSADDAGDGSDTTGTSTDAVRVEVFSWWTAPGEVEALTSLIDLHTTLHPNARVFNAASDPKIVSGGTEAKELLQQRLQEGNPPDAFQTNGFELHRGYLAAESDLLEPLDDLFTETGLSKDIFPELLETVTVDGTLRAVPVNVHRENSLFYNITVFNEHGIQPPNTMAEFLETCEKLKSEGVTPLAISTSQGWIINKVFVALALGSMGTDSFVRHFIDKEPMDAETIMPTIEVLDKVLTDYIDVEAAAQDGYGWTQAADALREGSTAMFIHGDWAKGYLTQLGGTPGVDFGVIATPDSHGAFVYGVDVFAVPAQAKHKPQGLDWLRTIASPAGQLAFNAAKGSSPIRFGVPMGDMDGMAAATYQDLTDSSVRLATVGLPSAWDEGFVQFAIDHDRDALLQIFLDNPIL